MMPGAEIVDFCKSLPQLFPQAVEFEFASYLPGPGLQDRLRGIPELEETFRVVSELRLINGYVQPYWESVLINAPIGPLFDRLVSEALKHNDQPNDRIRRCKRDEDVAEFLCKLGEENPGADIAFSSALRFEDGTIRCLPLLDFRCPVTRENQSKVEASLRALGLTRGILVNSGNSYHFYGYLPYSPLEWHRLMIKTVFLSPLLDSRFIAHRLLDGRAMLRVTCSARKPFMPRILKEYW